MRLALLVVLGLVACHDRPSDPVKPPAPTSTSQHGAGRDRWRGGGVYVDGTPVGVLRYAELPRGLQPVWETHRKVLPFKRGEPVRYSETKVPRFRVRDYLQAIGVDPARVTEVHLHGARSSAIVLTRDDLAQHADDLLFKFAGDTFGKPIPMIRGIKVGTSFDDLIAMTIYVDRKPPSLTADQTLELDGVPVRGIPYHGEPLRNGVRVYVDDRLAMVLKRNELATSTTGRFHLAEVLERNGVATTTLARAELIYDEARTATLAFADLDFGFQNTGAIAIGKDAAPAEAIALYTR